MMLEEVVDGWRSSRRMRKRGGRKRIRRFLGGGTDDGADEAIVGFGSKQATFPDHRVFRRRSDR